MKRPKLLHRLALAEDPEIGDVNVSLGFVSARIPISRSRGHKLWKLFQRKPLEECVEIPRCDLFIRILASDHGTIDGHLEVANFSSKPLQVEQFLIDWLGINGRQVNALPPQLFARRPIDAYSMGQVHFRSLLVAGPVREITEQLRPSSDPRCTPELRATLRGGLDVNQGSRRSQLQFQIEIPVLSLQISGAI